MYILKLNDLMFFVKSLKEPTNHFDIYQYVYFANNSTRSASFSKLVHRKPASSTHQHFYFNRIVRLWNHMPTVDLTLSTDLIKLTVFLWNRFISTFNSVLIMWYAPAINVQINQLLLTPMNCQTFDLAEQLTFNYISSYVVVSTGC